MSHAFRYRNIQQKISKLNSGQIKGAKLGRGHVLGKAEEEGLLGDEIILYPDCGEGHTGPKVCLNLWT